MSIVREHLDLGSAVLLDIGTGSGIMADEWSLHCAEIFSVDVVDQRTCEGTYRFQLIDDEHLPFPDGSFDLIISNQVLEHVWDQRLHVAEMHRVLKPGGAAYLSTPNKFALIEPHYRLPFLAWFGDSFASFYLRRLRGLPWEVKLLSFRSLRRLLDPCFRIHDAIPDVMRDPMGFHQVTNPSIARWLRLVPSFVWSARLNPLLPSFMVVLRKR